MRRPWAARLSAKAAVQRGQGLVEYGLILGGAALVAVITLVVFNPVLSAILAWIASLVDASSS